MAAPPAAHALRGLNSQQAAQAVAAAYVAAGLRTDPSPAAHERFRKRADAWLAGFSEWLEPDWWPMWPEAEQDALLDELEAARARYASSALTIPHKDKAPPISFALPTLVDMRTIRPRASPSVARSAPAGRTLTSSQTFCRLAYYVHQISMSPPPGVERDQWRLTAKEWFREGVTRRMSAWEFDDEPEELRGDVLDEFDEVRCETDELCPANLRLHALPPLGNARRFPRLHRLLKDVEDVRPHRSEQRHAFQRRERRRVNADLDRFRQDEPGADRREEEAEIHRAFARSRGIPIPTSPTHGPPGGVGPAHSLAHRSSARTMLSLRQQAVYGRGAARY